MEASALRVHQHFFGHNQHLLHCLRLPRPALDGGVPEGREQGRRDYVSRKDDVARMDEFVGPKS
jgi:hypothetical protein